MFDMSWGGGGVSGRCEIMEVMDNDKVIGRGEAQGINHVVGFVIEFPMYRELVGRAGGDSRLAKIQ